MSSDWTNKGSVATDSIERLLGGLGVNAVFGAPVSHEGVTVIPVAEVTMGFGFGQGGPASAETPSTASGGGGGGGGRGAPRGYIKISADGVIYEPLVDVNRLGLVGMLFAGWVIFWITLTIRTVTRAVVSDKAAS